MLSAAKALDVGFCLLREQKMTDSQQLCDTHDMVVIHRVFRREFLLLGSIVDQVADHDQRRAALVAAHAQEMVTALHHHHSGEDELLWPLLHQRAAFDDDQVDRMEQQHRDLAQTLEAIERRLPTWRQTADLDDRDALTGLFRQVAALLEIHLAEEERVVLPVVEKHVTAAERDQLSKQGMAGMPKSRLLVFLGHILEEADDDEAAAFLKKVPPPARLLYRIVGRPRYRREITQLRTPVTSAAA